MLLRLSEGRPTGLMANPVFLGAVCAAALWLVLARDRDSARPGGWLLVLGLLVGAVELSGTRSAEILAGASVVWFAIGWLRARAYLRALALVVAVAAGFLLAQLPAGSADSGSSRLSTSATSGLSTRVASWGDALDAVGERPVLGYGPGRTYVALVTPAVGGDRAQRRSGPALLRRAQRGDRGGHHHRRARPRRVPRLDVVRDEEGAWASRRFRCGGRGHDALGTREPRVRPAGAARARSRRAPVVATGWAVPHRILGAGGKWSPGRRRTPRRGGAAGGRRGVSRDRS